MTGAAPSTMGRMDFLPAFRKLRAPVAAALAATGVAIATGDPEAVWAAIIAWGVVAGVWAPRNEPDA